MRRWCDIGRVDIANRRLNRHTATIVFTVAGHTVGGTRRGWQAHYWLGLTFGRVILLGKVSIGKLTVSAIAAVESTLSPNINVNAGMTAESGFITSL